MSCTAAPQTKAELNWRFEASKKPLKFLIQVAQNESESFLGGYKKFHWHDFPFAPLFFWWLVSAKSRDTDKMHIYIYIYIWIPLAVESSRNPPNKLVKEHSSPLKWNSPAKNIPKLLRSGHCLLTQVDEWWTSVQGVTFCYLYGSQEESRELDCQNPLMERSIAEGWEVSHMKNVQQWIFSHHKHSNFMPSRKAPFCFIRNKWLMIDCSL